MKKAENFPYYLKDKTFTMYFAYTGGLLHHDKYNEPFRTTNQKESGHRCLTDYPQ